MTTDDAEFGKNVPTYTKLREDFDELLNLAKKLEKQVKEDPAAASESDDVLSLKGEIRQKFEEIHEIIDLF